MLEELINTACGQKALDADPEIRALLDKMLIEGEPVKKGTKWSRSADMMFEAYINALLSNPKTHMVNAVSNLVPLTSRIFETALAATSAKVFRTAGERATYSEVVAEIGGVAEGFVDAFRFMANRFKSFAGTNEEMLAQTHLPSKLAVQSKVERPGRFITGDNANFKITKLGYDFAGSLINKPGQALSTGDTFFKIINYRAEIAKQSWRKAISQDLGSMAETQQAYRQIKADTLSGARPEIVEKGLADADFRTYTNKPQGSWNQWMAGEGHTLSGMRWIVPFRRTLVNILNYGAELTPAPLFNPGSKTWKALKSGNPAKRDDAIGRMAFGSMAMGSLYYLLGDRLDGEAPMNVQARDLWAKDGHKADTIRFADGHFPTDMLGPLAPFVKALARYQQISSSIDHIADDNSESILLSMASDMLFATADVAFSEHWAENLADLVDSLSMSTRTDSMRPLVMYATRLGTGFIPNIVKQHWTKRVDPDVKDITSPMTAFIAKMPYWSKQVGPKVDLWGETMTYDHFLDPSLASKITGKDPVSVEMRSIGLKIPQARRTIMGVKTTPEEYHQYMTLAGKGSMGLPPLRDELIKRMTSKLYKRFNTDAGRAEYLNTAILTYRKAARAALVQNENFSFGQRVRQAAYDKQQTYGVSR